jgi:hypothetical protein
MDDEGITFLGTLQPFSTVIRDPREFRASD